VSVERFISVKKVEGLLGEEKELRSDAEILRSDAETQHQKKKNKWKVRRQALVKGKCAGESKSAGGNYVGKSTPNKLFRETTNYRMKLVWGVKGKEESGAEKWGIQVFNSKDRKKN